MQSLTVASIGAAPIASLGLAALALIITLLRWWWEEIHVPKLSLSYGEEHESQNVIEVQKPPHAPEAEWVKWYRLSVTNGDRRRTAQQAQVLVFREATEKTLGLDARPLLWSGAYVSSDEEDRTRELSTNVPPGVTRHVDLIRVIKRKGESACAEIAIAPRPSGGGHLLRPGETATLDVWATAVDAPSTGYQTVVHFNDGELSITTPLSKLARG
jgi:hypothetical protein